MKSVTGCGRRRIRFVFSLGVLAAVSFRPALAQDEPLIEAMAQLIAIEDAREFDEPRLKRIATPGHYCFISDTTKLIRKFEKLSHHIVKVKN